MTERKKVLRALEALLMGPRPSQTDALRERHNNVWRGFFVLFDMLSLSKSNGIVFKSDDIVFNHKGTRHVSLCVFIYRDMGLGAKRIRHPHIVWLGRVKSRRAQAFVGFECTRRRGWTARQEARQSIQPLYSRMALLSTPQKIELEETDRQRDV